MNRFNRCRGSPSFWFGAHRTPSEHEEVAIGHARGNVPERVLTSRQLNAPQASRPVTIALSSKPDHHGAFISVFSWLADTAERV